MALIPFGQCTTIGLRVPPKWLATCLVHWNGEFIAQALCLENGWHEAHTLRALERGQAAGILPAGEKLLANYRQLRRVEGILRRWSYEGETVLPDDPAPYYRVSVRCGFATPDAFATALGGWRAAVREAWSGYFDAPPNQ